MPLLSNEQLCGTIAQFQSEPSPPPPYHSSSQGSNSAGSVHLPGSYPHDQWQGSRIEGFVISQGQQITQESIEVGSMQVQCLRLSPLCKATYQNILSMGSLCAVSHRLCSSFCQPSKLPSSSSIPSPSPFGGRIPECCRTRLGGTHMPCFPWSGRSADHG